MQWRHVASHTGVVYNELADRVALFASRGGLVSAIGPLLQSGNPDLCHIPCPITDGDNGFLDECHDEAGSEVGGACGQEEDDETNGDALGFCQCLDSS